MWNNHGWWNGRKKTREQSKNHDSLQIETNVNSKKKIIIMKDNFKKCMFKEISGKVTIEMQHVRLFIM